MRLIAPSWLFAAVTMVLWGGVLPAETQPALASITGGCAGGALGPAHDVPGALCEDFDADRNGSGTIDWTRLLLGIHPCDPLRGMIDPNDDLLGYPAGGGPVPAGVAGQICSDDALYPQAQVTCHVVPSENDWHLHSLFEGCDDVYDARPAFDARCAADARAHSGYRSLHLGRHLNAADTLWDTYRFRQTSAFVMDPVLIGAATALEFWQIVNVCDDRCLGMPPGTTMAGGQVQISTLDPATGAFERWRPLTPLQNGYNAVDQSLLILCEFDPGDDLAPPLDETMCGGKPQWSDIGSVYGTDRTCSVDTDGDDPVNKDCGETTERFVDPTCSWVADPNCASFLENGSAGAGVWARSRFDLSSLSGRIARLRWAFEGGGGWGFGESRSFMEPEIAVVPDPIFTDEGWYIDDIRLTDVGEVPPFCVDPDGDGYGLPGDPSCPAGALPDCNCRDATIHPGAPEICDGLDNDCDGSVPANEFDADGDGVAPCAGDCDDANPAVIQVPGAIAGLAVADGSGGELLFTWDGQEMTSGTAIVYDSYAGSITALGPTGDFSTGSCEKNDLRDPAMTYRGPDPPVGDAFYFMFRGQVACPGGTGTWGTPNRDATEALSSSPCR